MVEVTPEVTPKLEPSERAKGFADVLFAKFSGLQPAGEFVQTAIQPREAPDLQSLPTLDAVVSEVANAADWKRQEYGGDYNYLSSGEPAGEHPEWQEDYLALTLPPKGEQGESWARMVLHRGVKDKKGKLAAYAVPFMMLDYYPAGKSPKEEVTSPARVELLFFSRWDNGIELASVTRIYKAK
jgi:hypothetical protein